MEEPHASLPKDTLLPPANEPAKAGAPSIKQQSWGTLISILIIVLMVVIGAFYAWGKRVAEGRSYGIPSSVKANSTP